MSQQQPDRSLLVETQETPAPFVDPGASRVPALVRAVFSYGVVCFVLGLISGLVWRLVTRRPSYRVGADRVATTTERGLANFFTADANFTVIGVVCGVLLGLAAWWWFGRRGWITVPLAIAGALLAALTCWQFGVLIAGQNFERQLASATQGEVIRIDLALSARSALMIWPLFAVLPVMLISSLAKDDPRPVARPGVALSPDTATTGQIPVQSAVEGSARGATSAAAAATAVEPPAERG